MPAATAAGGPARRAGTGGATRTGAEIAAAFGAAPTLEVTEPDEVRETCFGGAAGFPEGFFAVVLAAADFGAGFAGAAGFLAACFGLAASLALCSLALCSEALGFAAVFAWGCFEVVLLWEVAAGLAVCPSAA
ncbi:MAG: hypothetical protein R3D69_07550 [Xanthobacteraceae bacterium]